MAELKIPPRRTSQTLSESPGSLSVSPHELESAVYSDELDETPSTRLLTCREAAHRLLDTGIMLVPLAVLGVQALTFYFLDDKLLGLGPLHSLRRGPFGLSLILTDFQGLRGPGSLRWYPFCFSWGLGWS